MIAFIRLGTASTVLRSASRGILFYSMINDFFKDSILLWELEQAFVSRMDQYLSPWSSRLDWKGAIFPSL